MKEKEQDWYFTFGAGHGNEFNYVKLYGTKQQTLNIMNRRFQGKFCSQYKSPEEAGIKQLGLKELKIW